MMHTPELDDMTEKEKDNLISRLTRLVKHLEKKIERLEEELDICKAELKIEMDRW